MPAWLSLCAVLGAADAAVPPAAADTEPARAAPLPTVPLPATFSPFDVRPLPHLLASLSMLTLVGISHGLVTPALSGVPQCPRAPDGQGCDPQTLWAWDRSVVGLPRAPGWRRISDVGMWLGFVGPMAGALGERLPELLQRQQASYAWRAAASDLTVFLEVESLTSALNTLVKFAVRRPRPDNYSARPQSAYAQLSFPSGHTAAAAAGLCAYTTTFALRHGRTPALAAVAAGSLAITGLTGYGRVAGSMHFYSDVVAGAALGSTLGYLVPQLYRRGVTLVPLVQRAPAARATGLALQAPL